MADKFISQIKIENEVYKIRDSELDSLRSFLKELSAGSGDNTIGATFNFQNGVESRNKEVITDIEINSIQLNAGELPYLKKNKIENGIIYLDFGFPPLEFNRGEVAVGGLESDSIEG